MLELILIAIAIVSYLIGSINSAIIVGKIKSSGDDIRNHGSGNAGATNALRTYGKSAAVFVVLGDCLKSAISCIIAIIVAYNTSLGVENVKLGIYAAGIGAVLGHNFPLYFGFKGGKGILVSVTALMFANWKIALVILIISILVMAITKYVSIGSVLGAVLFIVLPLIFETDNIPYLIFCIILAVLAIYKHKTNIVRLIKGEENKISGKKK